MAIFRTRTQLYRAFGATDDLSLRKQVYKRSRGKVWIQLMTVPSGHRYFTRKWSVDYKHDTTVGIIRATNFIRDGVAITRSQVHRDVLHTFMLRSYRGSAQSNPSACYMQIRNWSLLVPSNAPNGTMLSIEQLDEKTKRLTWQLRTRELERAHFAVKVGKMSNSTESRFRFPLNGTELMKTIADMSKETPLDDAVDEIINLLGI